MLLESSHGLVTAVASQIDREVARARADPKQFAKACRYSSPVAHIDTRESPRESGNGGCVRGNAPLQGRDLRQSAVQPFGEIVSAMLALCKLVRDFAGLMDMKAAQSSNRQRSGQPQSRGECNRAGVDI